MATPTSLVTYGPPIQYQWTADFGGGVILAICLQVFLAEVRLACLMGLLNVTNLGELGNRLHSVKGLSSDHNPWLVDLLGRQLVRAVDFGGPDWPILLLFWNYLYHIRDFRVYYFGYTNSSLSSPRQGLTIWGGDGSTNPGTDGPHAHLSVTCENGFSKRFGTYNYAAALASTKPWGLIPWLQAYWRANPVAAKARGINPTPAIEVEAVTYWEDIMDYMLRPGDEIAVSVPFEANYFKADSYGPPGSQGRLQIMGMRPGGARSYLGNPANLDGAHAVPVPEVAGISWHAKDFSGAKYRKLLVRNTGTQGTTDPTKSHTVSFTIGREY